MTCPSCGTAERGRPEVLRRVRRDARARLPVVRRREHARRQVLRRVRRRGSRRRRRPRLRPRSEPRGGAAARLGALRRPRRLHDAVRERGTPRRSRELLSRYFDTARQVIERYGGTVEKFIGDAVMAVWGAPVAQEDDAERAVRAALDLVDAVAALGGRRTRLAARGRRPDRRGRRDGRRRRPGHGRRRPRQHGVARPVGGASRAPCSSARRRSARVRGGDRLRGRRRARAEGQGRAGARSGARSGSSRRRGGDERSAGARGAVRRPRPRAAARQGAVPRHRGRGQGAARLGRRGRRHRQVAARLGVRQVHRRARRRRVVAPGPLPRLRRGRHLLGARRDGSHARGASSRTRSPRPRWRSSATPSSAHVPDPEERRWVEPRLAHLLGLEERARPRSGGSVRGLAALLRAAGRAVPDGPGLRGPAVGRRRRCSTSSSTCSSGRATTRSSCSRSPARSCSSAGPTWGAGRRSFTLALPRAAAGRGDERRSSPGSCPGFRTIWPRRIRDRAEGVPLYAVETVRMLLDRGLLAREDGEYRSTGLGRGARGSRDAARADRGPARRPRRRTSAASSRTPRCSARPSRSAALAAVSGHATRTTLEPLLASLVRKEILTVQADPLSPERGQYAFLQRPRAARSPTTRCRRKERKARHLAVAAYLESACGRTRTRSSRSSPRTTSRPTALAPDADDAAEHPGDGARMRLTRAGERAASLAANAEAGRYFEQARRARRRAARSGPSSSSGPATWRPRAEPIDGAKARFEQAIALFEAEGDQPPGGAGLRAVLRR